MGDIRSAFGLRRTVTLFAVLLVTLSVAIAGSLITLTTRLHDTISVLRDTVRGVRLARQAEIDLLLRERATDPVERGRLEDGLRAALPEDEPGSSPAANAARAEARSAVERYLELTRNGKGASDAPVALTAALAKIDAVVRATVEDADRARAGAARLDELADMIGIAATALMIAVPVALLLWMRRSVGRPILALSDAMDRFGKGDLTVRAVPSGAAELRRMMAQFNSMGDALLRQHEIRLAHLAGVAHDLRNPLAALQMSASMVEAAPPPLDEPRARAFEIVRRQVGRLTRMVDDLLDATRIEAGQLSLVLAETDLRSSVRAAVELFENTSAIHSFSVDVAEEPLIVRCDALRIEQVLNNLLSNAIKYSPRGGSVRVSARKENGFASVTIKDEGVGIAESHLEEIWEPFKRTGVSTETVPGVGLGLWTSKKIVDAHGGTICAASALGKGSTFTLKLPLTAPSTVPILEAGLGKPALSHG